MKLHKLMCLLAAAGLAGGAGLVAAGVLDGAPPDLQAEAAFLNPAERLGMAVFFDRTLSEPAGVACATCHSPHAGWADPRPGSPTSAGAVAGRFGSRNAPSVAYAAHSPVFQLGADGEFVGGQFRDGRAATLEAQASVPLLNPPEMNNPGAAAVLDKLRAAPYAADFTRVFGAGALADPDTAMTHLAQALASFERSRVVNRFSSKYDAWLAGRVRLTPQEASGLAVFSDPQRGKCAACHSLDAPADGAPPLFTDFTYQNVGVPRNPANPFYRLPAQFNPAGTAFVDDGLGKVVGLAGQDGRFKIPSLRNVSLTGPYMHNGYFSSLRNVVAFYNTPDLRPACPNPLTPEAQALRQGCWPAPEVAANVNRAVGALHLSAAEQDDLVAFLGTLGDGWNALPPGPPPPPPPPPGRPPPPPPR